MRSAAAWTHPSTDPHSGTGGYALIAQSELPMVHDPGTAEGRAALLVNGPELAQTRIARFRLRRGQDASCLNLYRPTNPTIIAPTPDFITANRFTFASSIAGTDAERANPWLLLNRTFEDGAIPAIADATSLEYALHATCRRFFLDRYGRRQAADAALRRRAARQRAPGRGDRR